jgi:MFS family permease
MSNNLNLPSARLGWTIWGLAAAFYLFGFFQRVAPGVMTTELSADFGLSATALGSLSAFYFYSYVAMQIPTGILADIWGPRRLLTTGAIMASIGSLFFALSDDFAFAAIGRLLIGASVSVAFICMLKLANHWLHPKQFALASGMALVTGIVGAVFAGVPLHMLVESYGWRTVMGVASLFPVIIGLAIWFMVRDDPGEKGFDSFVNHEPQVVDKPFAHAMKGLKEVMLYRNTWLLAIVPGGVVGSMLSFAGLWGVPFLTTHHGLSTGNAAAICSAMLIIWATGGPIFGILSDRSGKQKLLYITGCAVVSLCWGMLLFIPQMPISILITVLMAAGFFSGCMVLGFAYAKESVPPRLAGTVSGVVNMGVMMGPMILQPAVGWMLDKNWAGEMVGGVKYYNLSAYQYGFSLMVLWAVVSFVLIMFTRENRR